MTTLQERINGAKLSYPIPIQTGMGVALDIGANIGGFALAYTNRFDRICCVEASKSNFLSLVSNVPKVEALHRAAYSHSELIVNLYEHSNMDDGSRSIIDHPDWTQKHEEVTTMSLIDLLREFNITTVDYMKVDIEGGEYDFLINQDLSRINAIGIELHSQIGSKRDALMDYLSIFFNLTHSRMNSSHIEACYEAK